MYIVVDDRQMVTSGYVASFKREGISSLGLYADEFNDWLETASDSDLEAVQGFVLGTFDERVHSAESIRRYSKAPIIALSDVSTTVAPSAHGFIISGSDTGGCHDGCGH
jgi:hypothetical protein